MHTLVTFVAVFFILIPIITAIVVWRRLSASKRKEFLYIGIIGAIIAGFLGKVASALFYNPRPFVEGHFRPYFAHSYDNGFPSDHTLLAAYLAFLVWRYDKKLGYYLIIIAALIGLSRVIAGVHHLIDVAGSFVIAALALYISVYLVKKLLNPRAHPVTDGDH